jgi:hypothetical protein
VNHVSLKSAIPIETIPEFKIINPIENLITIETTLLWLSRGDGGCERRNVIQCFADSSQRKRNNVVQKDETSRFDNTVAN